MTDENLSKAIYINNRIKDIVKFLEEFTVGKPLTITCLQSPPVRIDADSAEITDGASEEARKAIYDVLTDYLSKLRKIYADI